MVAAANRLFPEPGKPAPDSSEACESIGANILIAKDTDSVWAMRDSWVWREKPLFSNARVRVFGCRNATGRSASVR
jgi:hypothetical protein